jgi:hypothetical protein
MTALVKKLIWISKNLWRLRATGTKYPRFHFNFLLKFNHVTDHFNEPFLYHIKIGLGLAILRGSNLVIDV